MPLIPNDAPPIDIARLLLALLADSIPKGIDGFSANLRGVSVSYKKTAARRSPTELHQVTVLFATPQPCHELEAALYACCHPKRVCVLSDLESHSGIASLSWETPKE